MDEGLQVMIFMGLILKIPIVFACWIIYWAWKSQPDPAEAPEDGGSDRYRFRRPKPKRPRGPRRGPHAPDSTPLPCPEEESTRVARRPAAPRPLTASGASEHRR
jgi:hypothetical protein